MLGLSFVKRSPGAEPEEMLVENMGGDNVSNFRPVATALAMVVLLSAAVGCSPTTIPLAVEDADDDFAVEKDTIAYEDLIPPNDTWTFLDTETDWNPPMDLIPDTATLTYPLECDPIFDNKYIPAYFIEIADEEWDALRYEWLEWEARDDQGIFATNYHPCVVEIEGEVYEDAAIRLKGSPLNWGNTPDKMQFNISFKQYDISGRFRGMRKLNFDAPHNDPSLLRERLAMRFFREVGYPAPCANSAMLYFNEEYYGLYTQIEHVDQEFLQRNFGSDDDGNLYKYMEKKTNESDPDTSDLDTFMEFQDLESLESMLNMTAAVNFWAAETIIPQNDGYVVGGSNYFVYNHPDGMMQIPWDLDYSFDTAPANANPMTYEVGWGSGKPSHFVVTMEDGYYYGLFVDTIYEFLAWYEPEELQATIDEWADQMSDAIQEDYHKPFSNEDHDEAVATLRAYVDDRRYYLDNWIVVANGGGEYEIRDFNGESFLFNLALRSWDEGTSYCQLMGGSLAIPEGASEHEFMMQTAFELDPGDWWIGANDLDEEGVFTDPSGDPLHDFFWGPGQPNGDEDSNCVMLDYDLEGWNDKYCDGFVLPVICRVTD